MHEIRVSIMSPEAADHGVAELWSAGELIGHTILDDSDLMLRIEPRHDRTPIVVGAHSLAEAIRRATHLLERPETLHCVPRAHCDDGSHAGRVGVPAR